MAVIVTSMIIAGDDGQLLDDCCTLCGQDTPWVVNWRCYDHMVSACIACCLNIGNAGIKLDMDREDSKA